MADGTRELVPPAANFQHPGRFRLGRDSVDSGAGVCVFKKAREGLFTEYLDERQLPTSGGTYEGNPTWKGSVEQ